MSLLITPGPTPRSQRGRELWHAPSTRLLPATAIGWVEWYQRQGWSVGDALHHACEARHHEVTVQPSGRQRLALINVVPGTRAKPHHGPRPTITGQMGDRVAPEWRMVKDAWVENLLNWGAGPDPRTLASDHHVSKAEWQRLIARYRLGGVRYPAYTDPRSLLLRLEQLFERSLRAWGLPDSALGLDGRIVLVIGGATFPDRSETDGNYSPLSPHIGELHLAIDLPWNAFAHEWFHALDHWLGQRVQGLLHRKASFALDASQRGARFGRDGELPVAWGPAVDAWHAANRARTVWDHPEQGQAHWDVARRTFPQRMAHHGLIASSSRAAHERSIQYEQGCHQRWEHGLRHGEWSWMDEARHLSASLDRHRVGDRPFDPSAELDAWEGLFEGVVLLSQQQDRSRFGAHTLRHATVHLHRTTLLATPIDPSVNPDYFLHVCELNAWSFEASCDPCTHRWDRPFEHPWSVVRSVFPYAWGAQADREGSAWKALLQTLRPVLPGWSGSR